MMGFTLPGTCLSVLVLLAYAVVAWNPSSRQHMDRVSLRLLVYAIIANILFAIAFILDTSLHGPSAGCNFVAFLTNISLLFSACLLFCIALNLQLVLVHGVSGTRMEKWYIIGSTIVACALNVPVYALNQFGWNETNSTCWFSNPDDKIRLQWTIGTQSFWVLLIASGETVMFVVVVWYILRTDQITRQMIQTAQDASTTRNATSSKGGYRSTSSHVTVNRGYASKYRNIILRIGMYPLVSCILNYSTVGLDLYQTVDGVNTNLQFGLSVLDLVLYGLRTFFYAALAATDPSFLRAVHAFRNSHRTLIGPSSEMSNFRAAGRNTGILPSDLTVSVGLGEARSTRTGTGRSGQFAVHVELQQVRNTDSGVDIGQTVDGLRDSYGDGGNSEQGKNDLTGTSSCYEQDRKVESELGTPLHETGTGGAVIGIAARAEAARREQNEAEMMMDEEERASREFTRQI